MPSGKPELDIFCCCCRFRSDLKAAAKKKQIQVFDGEALYALKGVAGSTYVMFQSSH
jgi:hypothetical protein